MTNPRFLGGGFRTGALALALLVFSAGLSAMTVIPIRDGELYRRADVVVHGIVVSSDTVATEDGRPETVTVIRPLRVLKGQLAGYLVLHQLGGVLRGGTGLRLYGRPEYTVGEEVVVFAIEREEGDFQTAEMLLGKFPIERDDAGRLFAVPALAAAREGVQVLRRPDLGREAAAIERADETSSSPLVARSAGGSDEPDSLGPPRELSRFLDFLGNGGVRAPESSQLPEGKLQPVIHQEPRMGLVPEWANFGDDTPPLVRWFNGATAAFYLDPSTGSPNITPGGGVAEATTALGWWTNDPNSTINYTKTSDTTKEPIHMSAASSSCGWNTCIGPMESGVVGCGGPAFTVPGSPCPAGNMFRGDCYGQIMDFPSAQPPLKAAEVCCAAGHKRTSSPRRRCRRSWPTSSATRSAWITRISSPLRTTSAGGTRPRR